MSSSRSSPSLLLEHDLRANAFRACRDGKPLHTHRGGARGQAQPIAAFAWRLVLMMRFWNRVEQAMVGVLGLIALAFALWQILSRYFFPRGAISYAEEVIVYLMIWAIMIVSSQLVDTDGHVRPDLVFN